MLSSEAVLVPVGEPDIANDADIDDGDEEEDQQNDDEEGEEGELEELEENRNDIDEDLNASEALDEETDADRKVSKVTLRLSSSEKGKRAAAVKRSTSIENSVNSDDTDSGARKRKRQTTASNLKDISTAEEDIDDEDQDFNHGGGGGADRESRANSYSASGGGPGVMADIEAQLENIKKQEFVTDLYNFMEEKGRPINKVPSLGYQELDLFKLYWLVVSRGGMDEVKCI